MCIMSTVTYDTCFARTRETIQSYHTILDDIFNKSVEEYKNVLFGLETNVKDDCSAIMNLRDSIGHCNNKFKESKCKIQTLSDELNGVIELQNTLEKEHSSLKSRLESINSLVTQAIEEKMEIVKACEDLERHALDQEHMNESIRLCKRYLGVEFRTLKNNRIQFTFCNAVKSKPDAVMFVIIQLIDKVYSVLDSEPELNNLKELEAKLNESNNLAGFVQHIREVLLEEALKSL